MKISEFIKTHQQKIALTVGYLLIASLAFVIGRVTAFKYKAPDVKIEQAFEAPTNYTSNVAGAQSSQSPGSVNCQGKIKGNVSSSGKIYHLPGGSFYNRTNPEMCFATEAEAKAAGFRKSLR